MTAHSLGVWVLRKPVPVTARFLSAPTPAAGATSLRIYRTATGYEHPLSAKSCLVEFSHHAFILRHLDELLELSVWLPSLINKHDGIYFSHKAEGQNQGDILRRLAYTWSILKMLAITMCVPSTHKPGMRTL